jgi:hypothetical protein
MNTVTLLDFMSGRASLDERHLRSLRVLLINGVRAQWKKNAITNLTLHTLRLKERNYSYQRIMFYQNGSCDYVAGQDYTTEIKVVRELLIS